MNIGLELSQLFRPNMNVKVVSILYMDMARHTCIGCLTTTL